MENPKKAIAEVEAGEASVIDVRRDDELQAEGTAKGAIHLDSDLIFAGQDPNLPHDRKIYTYCRSGGRAGRVKAELEKRGYTNVHNLGGFKDSKAAGGPVEELNT